MSWIQKIKAWLDEMRKKKYEDMPRRIKELKLEAELEKHKALVAKYKGQRQKQEKKTSNTTRDPFRELKI